MCCPLCHTTNSCPKCTAIDVFHFRDTISPNNCKTIDNTGNSISHYRAIVCKIEHAAIFLYIIFQYHHYNKCNTCTCFCYDVTHILHGRSRHPLYFRLIYFIKSKLVLETPQGGAFDPTLDPQMRTFLTNRLEAMPQVLPFVSKSF